MLDNHRHIDRISAALRFAPAAPFSAGIFIRTSDKMIAKDAQALRRFWEKVIFFKDVGCLVWIGARGSSGYGHFRIGSKIVESHRIAWVLANGEIPLGMQVLHRCDNPACVNKKHLFLGTHDDNMADKAAKGRSHLNRPKGEEHASSKFTDADVLAIRASTKSSYKLAAEYGVYGTTILSIRNRKTWKHI